MQRRMGSCSGLRMRHDAAVCCERFLGKLVVDVLPAALRSVIGGFLFAQYQFSHATAPHPATEQAVPASAEMMQLVRDEHAVIIDYLKAQMAAEKSRARRGRCSRSRTPAWRRPNRRRQRRPQPRRRRRVPSRRRF